MKTILLLVASNIFMTLAWIVLKEKLTWNYAVSFALIVAAVYFATAFKPSGGTPGGH